MRPQSLALALLLMSCLATGCSGGRAPDVKVLESNIERDLDDQLMGQLATRGGFPPRSSVSCPRQAKLTKGRVLVCTASIQQTRTDTPQPGELAGPTGVPQSHIETHHLSVTVLDDSGKARWKIVD
jgi:hypothetical protein